MNHRRSSMLFVIQVYLLFLFSNFQGIHRDEWAHCIVGRDDPLWRNQKLCNSELESIIWETVFIKLIYGRINNVSKKQKAKAKPPTSPCSFRRFWNINIQSTQPELRLGTKITFDINKSGRQIGLRLAMYVWPPLASKIDPAVFHVDLTSSRNWPSSSFFSFWPFGHCSDRKMADTSRAGVDHRDMSW